jgi:hypothetical protein
MDDRDGREALKVLRANTDLMSGALLQEPPGGAMMDIHDGANWTELDVENPKAAAGSGSGASRQQEGVSDATSQWTLGRGHE